MNRKLFLKLVNYAFASQRPNDLHKLTAKLKLLNFDYERIFQAQQDLKKTELFAGQFNALVSPHQGQLCNEAVTT